MRPQSRPGVPPLLLWPLIGAGMYLGLLGAGMAEIVVLRFALLVGRQLMSLR